MKEERNQDLLHVVNESASRSGERYLAAGRGVVRRSKQNQCATINGPDQLQQDCGLRG